MAEPLFGSVSPIWPAIPAPAFGYFQTPIPYGNRPFAGTSPGIFASPQGPSAFQSGVASGAPAGAVPSEAYAFGSPLTPTLGGPMMPTLGGPGFAPGLSAVLSTPTGVTFPAYAGAEIGLGVPAPALLAAVAMRRGQPLGPTNDQEIEDFLYDALDLLPGANEVEVRSEGARVTLTGTVQHKRLKRDVGEIVWAIPGVNDVQNNVTIAARRRARGPSREAEAPAAAGRKQA